METRANEDGRSVRETSIEAYRAVMESGYVGRRQREVYDALYQYGPCTAGELFYRMSLGRNPTHSNVSTRLGELRERGVVTETGKRECTQTGMTVIVWDVTRNSPTAPPTRHKRTRCIWCEGRGYHETIELAIQLPSKRRRKK